MLRQLKFPLLYAVEALLWVPLIAGFYGAASFLAARPVSSLDLQGKALPVDWEAAIPSHGTFVQGFLIQSHPIAFAFVVGVLLMSAALLYKVRKAQILQRQEAAASGARAHAVAQGCVFAIIALLGYVFITRVMVSASAA